MISTYTDYHGAIRVYDNVYSDYKHIIDTFNETAENSNNWIWRRSKQAKDIKEKHRKSLEIRLPTKDVDYSNLNPNQYELNMLALSQEVQTIIRNHIEHYAKDFGIIVECNERTKFIKYDVGEYFTFHRDDHPNTPRVFSSLLYVNDDYVGGDLHFKYFGFSKKPKAGDLFVFPSNYAYSHESVVISSGTKYAITDFWEESFRSETQYEE